MSILLIEDDFFFRKFYVEKLKGLGYEIDEAENGVEGLKQMRAKKPDLVILDIIMPQMDGFEVLKTAQLDPTLKDIPIIVFSTLGQETDVAKAKQLGAKDFTNKSLFDFNDLAAKINQFIKKN